MRRFPLFALAAGTMAIAGCGDDTETVTERVTNRETVTETRPVRTEATQPGASGPAITEAQAEEAARNGASMNLPPTFTVRPSDWAVSCSGGETGGPWRCQVSSGPCSGEVRVIPEGNVGGATVADASRVGCIAD